MSYLPCQNPSCHSYGKPHPNCRCYGAFAEGGDAFFCAARRQHEKDCEYFAEGGDVVPDSDLPGVNDVSKSMETGEPGLNVFSPKDDQFKPVPEDDLPTQSASGSVPEHDLPETHEPGEDSLPTSWAETGQRLLHSGLLQEVPPEAPEGSKLTPEDFQKVSQDQEKASRIGIMFSPLGSAKLIPEAVAGARALNAMVSNGLIQMGDEASKYLMGDKDPQDGVGAVLAHIAGAGLFGLGAGAIGAKVTDVAALKARDLANKKLGNRAVSFLAGLGAATNESRPIVQADIKDALGDGRFHADAFNYGQSIYRKLTGAGAAAGGIGAGAIGGGVSGWDKNGVEGAISGAAKGAGEGLLGSLGVKLIGKVVSPALSRVATPVILKALQSGNVSNLIEALNYAQKMEAGVKTVGKSVDSLFRSGVQQEANFNPEVSKKKLKDYIDLGGKDADLQEHIYQQNEPQGYATGGEVKRADPKPVFGGNPGIADHFPEHNVMLNMAKGRVSNYLTSMKPNKHHSKLAFDDIPDQRDAEKSYDQAIDIAVRPLSVLEHVRKGTAEPDHVKHLNSMYPEVSQYLQKKITERILQAQLDGEKPSFKVRQGLSLFMGTPLSSEFTPQAIQAAQSVFVQGKQQPPSPQKSQAPKKNSASLSKSDQAYLTSEQAREKRQTRPS